MTQAPPAAELAADLADHGVAVVGTGADDPAFVFVRAPGGAGAVSAPETGLARAELDQATLAMVGEPDYPASVGAFSGELADPGVGVAGAGVILLVTLAVLAVAALAAYRAARTRK